MSEEANQSEIIYHYTSLETFFKIIESKELRMYPVNQMNDPKESIYLLEHLDQMVIYPRAENYPRIDMLNMFMQKALKQKKDLHSLVLQAISKPALLCSFSKLPGVYDGITLWREYGDYGHGIALGINRKNLEALLAKKDTKETKVHLSNVYYDSNNNAVEQLKELLVASILDDIVKLKQEIDNREIIQCVLGNSFIQSLDLETSMTEYYLIFILSSFIKHPAYKVEKEVRCVLDYRLNKNHEFKVDTESHRSYHPIPLAGTGLLESIVVGSNCRLSLLEIHNLVSNYFLRLNSSNNIYQSQVPMISKK